MKEISDKTELVEDLTQQLAKLSAQYAQLKSDF